MVVCGTFEADPASIRRDAERALRLMRLETIDLFLVFWVRSWRRLSDDVMDGLQRMRADGLVRHFSLSTHDRGLAAEAIRRGWDPIMCRHSAAHRGVEATVLPTARQAGAGVLTFSNLCYGRILTRPDGDDRGLPEPAEFYRYSLSQPGVTCCWSAPSTLDQLEHNLTALDRPHLPADRVAALRDHGARVYRDNLAFRVWVRER